MKDNGNEATCDTCHQVKKICCDSGVDPITKTRDYCWCKNCCPHHGRTTRTPESYVNALDTIKEQFRTNVLALAAKYRAEIIVPVCRKYKLTFSSGMGMFGFSKRGSEHSYSCVKDLDMDERSYRTGPDKLSNAAREALRPILEVLCTDVAYNWEFGESVEGVE